MLSKILFNNDMMARQKKHALACHLSFSVFYSKCLILKLYSYHHDYFVVNEGVDGIASALAEARL